MIGYIKGAVSQATGQLVIIEVHGVGIQVAVPHAGAYQVGKPAQIMTHLHWNQAHGPSLYGFGTAVEKSVFILLIGCPGVGPKMALSALATLNPAQIIRALTEHDIKLLTSVSGIGAKKAEQMVVQLRHKVIKLYESGELAEHDAGVQDWHQVSQALQSLNYSRTEVQRAAHYLHEECAGKQVSFDQLLRQALSFLAKQK